MRRTASIAAVSALLASLLIGSPALADDHKAVRAELDGKPIPIEQIPDFYCHDHDFPLIHCFSSGALLDAAITAERTAQADLTASATAATDYVVVFSGQSYSGSYMFISSNYDTLVPIGWNDRIRSYRGLNSALGSFYTDWLASGQRVDFCCNTTVPILASSVDHQFSSVYRR
jgi:hypothetical protein